MNSSIFIHRTKPENSGLRIAVKDIIDMSGLPTTLGSRFVERKAEVASKDAVCLHGIRKAEELGKVAIVGEKQIYMSLLLAPLE